MYEREDVVQRTLAQAAVVTNESHHHLGQLKHQKRSPPVAVESIQESGHTPLEVPIRKEKIGMADADLETKRTIAW